MKIAGKVKRILAAVLCIALGAALAATGTWAYLTNKTVKPLTNTFVAMGGGKIIEDEDDFRVAEHEITYDPDGTPKLTDTEKTPEPDGSIQQQYKVEPGIDLPKDPFIRVNGKTETPAMLYVEVVPNGFDYVSGSRYKISKVDDGANNEMSFELNSDWALVTGVTGNNGGEVYRYVGAKSNPTGIITLDSAGKDNDFYLLKDNKIVVENDVTENGEDMILPQNCNIKFYAYLAQANAGDTPAAVFSNCFGAAPVK